MAGAKLRILIVEDEALVAMLIEDVLNDLGHEVVAVGGRVAKALQLAQNAAIDFAILDLNLNGEHTYSIAETLQARRVPFIFATGYGSSGVDDAWSEVRVLSKPFEPQQLAAAIEEARPG